MAITKGFGMSIDTDGFKVRKWVMKGGVKYWLDECEELPDDEPDFGDYCHDCGEDTCCCDLDA